MTALDLEATVLIYSRSFKSSGGNNLPLKVDFFFDGISWILPAPCALVRATQCTDKMVTAHEGRGLLDQPNPTT